MQFTATLGHAVGIACHNFVVTAVGGQSLSHHQGAAVTLKQQLDVLRLLDRFVILQPDHLQHSSSFPCDLSLDQGNNTRETSTAAKLSLEKSQNVVKKEDSPSF